MISQGRQVIEADLVDGAKANLANEVDKIIEASLIDEATILGNREASGLTD